MIIRHKKQLLVYIVVSAVLFVSCGRKTPPIPPYEAIPQAINDLRYQQRENNITLTWTYPEKTSAGSKLLGVEGFQIYRAVVPESEYCAGCPVKFTSVVELEAGKAIIDPEERFAQYTERLLRPDHRYLYKVNTKAGWRLLSDDSNMVSFLWKTPAPAPVGLEATPGDTVISLHWQAPEKMTGVDNETPIFFQVYRSQDDGPFSLIGEPTKVQSYSDSGLTNGKPYSYKVRSVFRTGNTSIVGLPSRAVSVTPRDLTPPAPPRNLMAVKSNTGVKIIWERGAEMDLAGYKIYRRLLSETKITLLGTVKAPNLTFIDNKLPLDMEEWYYSVSAFDGVVPVNESPLSKEIRYESF